MGQIFNLTPEEIDNRIAHETKQAMFSEQNRELFKVRKELAEVATAGRAFVRTRELARLQRGEIVDPDTGKPIVMPGILEDDYDLSAIVEGRWKSPKEYDDYFTKEDITDSLYWQALDPVIKSTVEPRLSPEGDRMAYVNELVSRKEREQYLQGREISLVKELDLGGATDTASAFAAGFAATMTDPVEWAINFIPVGGWFTRIPGTKTAVRKLAGRAGRGAIEGLFGAAVVEPFVLSAADADGADYDHWDSLMNLAFAPVVGGTMHMTLGTLGDAFGLNLNEKTAANRKAAADMLGDGRVNVLDQIFNDRIISQANTLEAIEMESRFLQDLVDGKVKDAEGKPVKLNNDQRNQTLTILEQNKAAMDAGDARISPVSLPEQNKHINQAGQAMKEPPEYGSPKDDYHVENTRKINDEYEDLVDDIRTDEEVASAADAFESVYKQEAGNVKQAAQEVGEDFDPDPAGINQPPAIDSVLNRIEGHKEIADELATKSLLQQYRLYREGGEAINQLAQDRSISLNRRDAYTKEVRALQQSQAREKILHEMIRDRAPGVFDVVDLDNDKTVKMLIKEIRKNPRMAAVYTGADVIAAIRDLQTKTKRYTTILSKRAGIPQDPTNPLFHEVRRAAIDLARREIEFDNFKKHANFAQAFIKSEVKFEQAKIYIDNFRKNNPKATFADAYYAYMGTDFSITRTGPQDVRISTDLRQESASADLKNGLLAELRAYDLDPFVIANEGPFHLSGTARDAIHLMTLGKAGPSGVKKTKVKGRKLSPRQMEEDIAQEMWNLDFREGDLKFRDTGNTRAKEIASLYHKYLEHARLKQNALGASIDELRGRIVGQTHDLDKMMGPSRRGGGRLVAPLTNYEKYLKGRKNAWKDSLKNLLDHERTFKGADPDEWLDAAWAHIIAGDSERLGAWDASMYRSTENFGDAISKSRKMHFKNPQAWMDYNNRYGKTDLFGSVMNELERGGRNIGLMETHGPDPYAFHNRMKDHLRRGTKEAGKEAQLSKLGQGQENRLDNLFAEINGSLDIPVNRLGAQAVSNARAMANMAYLPRVIFSVPADITQWSAMQRRMGVRWLDRMMSTYFGTPFRLAGSLGRNVGNIFTGWGKRGPVSLSEKQTAAALKLGFDYLTNTSASRYNLIDQPGRFFQRAQDRFFKLNLLQDWDNSTKTAVMMSLSKMMDDFSGKTWGQLNKANTIPGVGKPSGPKFTQELQRYGINKGEWEVIRLAREDVEGTSLVTPEALKKLTPAQARKANPKLKTDADAEAFIAETVNKLRMFYIDSARTAVPTPGAAQRAMGKLGTQRGTVKGEIMRSFWQFKSFMWTIMTRTWGRERAAGRVKGYSAIIGTAGVASMLGFMSNWLSAVSRGERYGNKVEKAYNEVVNLGDWSEATKLGAAAVTRGGGLGFYGDLIFADPKERARKGVTGAVGPVLGMADDLAIKLPYAWLNYSMSNNPNQDLKAKSMRTALRYTPVLNFTQMAYSKTIMDLLFFNDASEMLSPGYQMRMRRRALQKYGTEYWTTEQEPFGPRRDKVIKAPATKGSDPKQEGSYNRFKEKYGNKKIFF